ncbi:zinc finger BED domain-containing protein RICESLEEPER 2-like [Vicia villosa]|uniref:zinc finger BED domain-containing protein RICESLEEPER 2-like n=1 Tax=Vicia villosa TaxID=3911 RepID=UPI00273B2121|nr:zinc finger BED domain-containing protein RICESLEEPER 2-like [Vicia villosa]
MTPPHTGRELSLKVLEMLSDWGIENNVFSITLDNASANDSMQRFLKEHLELINSLLFKGNLFHIRCCAHILNLIVQDGLKVVSDALYKIRQSVAYVKVTESRRLQFHECVSNVGEIETTIGLRSDCVTRWNSTFIMLKSAINYRRAFYSLSLRDSNFKCCPSSEEWARSEIMSDLLKLFYNITNLIFGSSYPPSNLYFEEIWRIECLLNSI